MPLSPMRAAPIRTYLTALLWALLPDAPVSAGSPHPQQQVQSDPIPDMDWDSGSDPDFSSASDIGPTMGDHQPHPECLACGLEADFERDVRPCRRCGVRSFHGPLCEFDAYVEAHLDKQFVLHTNDQNAAARPDPIGDMLTEAEAEEMLE